MVSCSMVWCCLAWHGMAWESMAWHGMAWQDITRGAGVHQPGSIQHWHEVSDALRLALLQTRVRKDCQQDGCVIRHPVLLTSKRGRWWLSSYQHHVLGHHGCSYRMLDLIAFYDDEGILGPSDLQKLRLMVHLHLPHERLFRGMRRCENCDLARLHPFRQLE